MDSNVFYYMFFCHQLLYTVAYVVPWILMFNATNVLSSRYLNYCRWYLINTPMYLMLQKPFSETRYINSLYRAIALSLAHLRHSDGVIFVIHMATPPITPTTTADAGLDRRWIVYVHSWIITAKSIIYKVDQRNI